MDFAEQDILESATQAALSALRRVLLAGDQFRHTVAAHYSVGVTETIAMSHLAADGALTARELAGRLELSPSAVTSILDRLELSGMARRTQHATDRRRTPIELTELGASWIAWSSDQLRSAFELIAPGELATITDGLGRVAEVIHVRTERLKAGEVSEPAPRPQPYSA